MLTVGALGARLWCLGIDIHIIVGGVEIEHQCNGRLDGHRVLGLGVTSQRLGVTTTHSDL